MQYKQVVVIGAGLAGLMAARIHPLRLIQQR